MLIGLVVVALSGCANHYQPPRASESQAELDFGKGIKGVSNCLEIKLVLAGCEHSGAPTSDHA
jgi:hypothetical protein